VITHRDREKECLRSLAIDDPQDLARQIGVRIIGWGARPAECFPTEEVLEPQRRHRQIAAEEAAIERVQTDRPIPSPAQPPDMRLDRGPRQRVIRVETVVAEVALRDAGQHGEFGAHRVRAPTGNDEVTELGG